MARADDVAKATDHAWDELTEALGDEHEETYLQHEPAFREHFDENYATGGYGYETLAPAYRYGTVVAEHPDYTDQDWEDLQPEIRQRWQEFHSEAWDEVEDAIRHAWDEVQSKL